MEAVQREPLAESRLPEDGEGLTRLLKALSETAAKMNFQADHATAATLFLSTLRSHYGCRRAVLTQTDEGGRDHQWFFAGLSNAEIDYFHAHRPSPQTRDGCLMEKFRVGESYSVPAAECPGLGGLKPGNAKGDKGIASAELLFLPLRGSDARLLGTLLIDDGRDAASRPAAALAAVELFTAQMARIIEKRRLDHSARNAQQRLRSTEEQLLQSEKLSAIGQLISGVAHELNNPLSGVMGFTQLLQSSENNPKIAKNLERIYSEAGRCQKIVQNLLSFARRHKPEKSAHTLAEVIEGVLDLRAYQLQVDDVEVERRYDAEVPPTMLDFHQLQQVVLNLVNNAHHAMMATIDHPRRLTITTDRRDGMLRASFTDTGAGIPQDRIAKLFEPFFTTKEVGKGTGLGLSVSLAIIKAHQGTMNVESALGQGTTFWFEVPLVECKPTAVEAPSAAPSSSAPAPRLRILVVDDEAVLTELLTDVLKSVGHDVDTASDGRDALRKALENSYDVILSDLKMPGLDGHGLYDALIRQQPHMSSRFIFTTGDIVSQKVQAFFKENGCSHLSKPFKLEAVIDTVNEVSRRQRAA